MPGETTPVTDESFEREVIQSESPVLVYFWADWCKECRPLLTVVGAVASEKRDQVKTLLLDVDANPRVAQRYAINMVPTLILFIHGRECGRLKGLTNAKHLSATIEMHLADHEQRADEEWPDIISETNE